MPPIAAAALRRGPLLGLGLAAALSFASLAAIPHDGFRPLAQLACLLPLQLAALFVVCSSPQRGGGSRRWLQRPPASGLWGRGGGNGPCWRC